MTTIFFPESIFCETNHRLRQPSFNCYCFSIVLKISIVRLSFRSKMQVIMNLNDNSLFVSIEFYESIEITKFCSFYVKWFERNIFFKQFSNMCWLIKDSDEFKNFYLKALMKISQKKVHVRIECYRMSCCGTRILFFFYKNISSFDAANNNTRGVWWYRIFTI